ncbi:DUF2520 domain-containing protein, partial [Mycetohabitans sp. B6]|nr:DUF2520 domain-containing protein [Mycetohabitans sp. B6]
VSVIGSQLDTLAALGEDHMALYAMLTRRVAALARRRSPAPPGLDAIEATVATALQRGTDAPAPHDGTAQRSGRVPPRP